jgi:shikimate dehydrogenase
MDKDLQRREWDLVFEASEGVAYKTGVAGLGAIPISASTRYCAVLGHPIRHSASPAMHNAALEEMGLDWRYLAFAVHPEQLREAIEGARAMRFVGLNLTVPHKLLAMELVDELDSSAREWGAVNTIRFEAREGSSDWRGLGEFAGEVPDDIRAVGFNTDADAVVRALEEGLGLGLRGLRVVLLGAGGAGRTAALKLASEGVGELCLVNRTAQRAVGLAEEVRCRYPGVVVGVGYPVGSVDLVLNATSLGLRAGDESPLDSSRMGWERVGAVYDMIYRPAETRLLREARAAGCRGANGLGMLLYQGARALELWSGRVVPVEVMRRALELNLYGGVCN